MRLGAIACTIVGFMEEPQSSRSAVPPMIERAPSSQLAAADSAPVDAELEPRSAGAAIVTELLEVARLEGEAAIASGAREVSGDLVIRAVLLSWDLGEEAEEGKPLELSTAERWLYQHHGHPLAARLALARALSSFNEAALAEAQAGILGGDAAKLVERAELALWLAEAWQLGLDQPPPAAVLELLAASEGPHGPALVRLAGRPSAALAERAAAAVGPEGQAAQRAEAAGLLLDSGVDPRAAMRLCARVLADSPADQLRCLELAIEARLRGAAGEELATLWRERAALAAELPGGALDAMVSRVLACESESPAVGGAGGRSRHAELAALAEAPAVRDPLFGPLYLRMRSLTHAIVAADTQAALALRAQLASESPCAVLAACHAARAALGFEAAGGAIAGVDRQRIHQLAQLADERLGGPGLAELRDRAWLRLPPDAATAIPQLVPRGAIGGLRWAAHLTEHKLRDLAGAVTLWQRVAEQSGAPAAAAGKRNAEADGGHAVESIAGALADSLTSSGFDFTADHLASCHRRLGELTRLAAAYEALAGREPPRNAAVWRCAAGALALQRDELDGARALLERAAEAAPRDPVCRVGLLRIHTARGDWAAAAKMLEEVLPRLNVPSMHRRYMRELAILSHQHLARSDEAERAFEQILAEDPLDAATLVALGSLYEQRKKPMLAIAAKRRAADLLPGRVDKLRLLLEVAELCRQHAEPEEGRDALEQAQRLDPEDVEVQRLLAELYEHLGEHERAVVALRAELARRPDPARRLEVQLRLATLLSRLEVEPESVVAAYLDVLAADPGHAEALAGIQAPARALGWWDALVRAFRAAPPTAQHLELLAQALEKMSNWAELAKVRQSQLEAAADRGEQLQRALALASLHELQLGDADAAIRMLRFARSLSAAADQPALTARIAELLEASQRWADLVELLQQEVDKPVLSVPPDRAAAPEVAAGILSRRLALLLRIARLRGERLHDIEGAVRACEEVLRLSPAPASAAPEDASRSSQEARDAQGSEEAQGAGESTLEQPVSPEHEAALTMLEELHQQRSDHSALAKVLRARASATEIGARGVVLARLAQIHSTDGDIDDAIAAYQAAIEAAPADRDIFTAYERLCYAELRWDDALRLYETAISYVEGGAARAYRLTDLYSRKAQVQSQYVEDLDGAIESLTKLISLDGNPEAGANSLEEICAIRNDYEPLVSAFERRASSTRDVARKVDAYRRAALIAETHLDAPERVAELRKRLFAIDPTDVPSAAALEAYYRERKDIPGLIELLRLQLTGSRDQGTTIGLLQRIAEVSEEEARDVDGAISHYLKILELEPTHTESLEALGRIYESTERWVELIDVTRRQIKGKADRNSKALLYFRCGSVMEAKFGREEDAIRYYEAAIKVSAACMPAIHGLRDLYRRRQDWQRVIETLELEVKLWQEDKERAGVLAQIGQVYSERLANNAQAMQCFEEALAVDPDCVPANLALFEHYFATSSWDLALPLANALTQRAMRDGDPATRSEFYRKRGLVSLRTGEPRVAADSLVAALEIRPTNVEALESLGALVRDHHEVYDFETTYRELEKVYRRRDDAAPLLARVWIGLATVAERAGDLDTAAELCGAATELAPADFTVLSSVVEFHCDMRRWAEAASAIEAFLPQAAASDRTRALLRQAEIHADGELDALRAIAVLREVLRVEPGCHEAYYALAQQYYLHSRFAEARTSMDRAIELATAPEGGSPAAVLARYYYYKGRVLEASGDSRSGAAQYRRASEHDPGYAPPALILSHRAAEAGDQRHAESLLIDAARAAIAQGGNVAAVPMQRGLARILLATGERAAAIEAYRGILAVTPDNASDRVALAEIYAVDDLPRAIAELRKVLELDIHHAPAYRLLASFYARTGETDRAGRVLAALDLLGFAEDADRSTAQRLRTVRLETPLVRSLDLDHRYHLLATRAMRDVLGELWSALAEEITALFPPPALGENLVALADLADPVLEADYAAVARIFETQAEVFLGERVPGMAAVVAFPRPIIVLDRTLATEGAPARRFLFGWALDAIRGGYAMLLTLGAAQRRELTQLLRSLLASDRDRSGAAVEIARKASPRGAKVLERYAGRVRDLDVGGWIDGMQANAKRSGLLACDEFTAAIWMIARLSGEGLPSHYAMVALGAVLGGADLVRYYLSDDYQRLRDILTTPTVAG